MSATASTPGSLEPFDLSLHEVKAPDAGKTVTVEGRLYKVVGEEAKVQRLRETLGSSDVSAKHLDATLLTLGMQDFTSAKAKAVSSQIIVGSLTGAQRAAIAAMNLRTLEKWIAVRDAFNQAREELAGCVPEGCAAYARLVLPNTVEQILGKLELCKGKTGSQRGREVDEDTLANIGSSGKLMTALTAAVLAHGKYLRFDDFVCRYFPKEVMAKFQQDCNGKAVSPKAITVDMLASMTAGLTYDSMAGVEATPEELSMLSQDELLRRPASRDCKIPFMARPGDGICTYSNLQMQLLAYVIEKSYKEKALKTLLHDNPELADRKVGSFLEKGGGRIAVDQVPLSVLSMTLHDFEKVVSDPKRQNAYDDRIDSSVYIYDVIDGILGQESHRVLAFDEILAKELLQPLGIQSATFVPGTAVRQAGQVLTIGKKEVLAQGEGVIPPYSNLIFGAGDLFMSPVEETRFIQALMSPAVMDSRTNQEMLSREEMDKLFTIRNRNLPSWTVGGTSVERGDFSVSVEKGGSLDEYHHNFRWERVIDPSNLDRAVGRFMWGNFLGTPEDSQFCRCFGRVYEKAASILQSERPPGVPGLGLQFEKPFTFSEAEEKPLLSHPERVFLGTPGLVSYSSKDNFLHWKGITYRIQRHGENEFIVVNDELVPVRFGEDDKRQKFIQVGDEKVHELSKEALSGAINPEGHAVVSRAESYYQGDRGLIAYSKGKFLYWAGVAYNIHTHDGKEYIFIEGRPCLVETWEVPELDPTMRYIQVDEAQASEISKDLVLEAAKTKRMREDLADARSLLPHLQGRYFGDHKPTGTNGTFTVDSHGVLCLKLDDEPDAHERPLQLIKIHRDAENRIDELHVCWSKEPPDKMMKFVRVNGDEWKIEITEFLTGTLCETCISGERKVESGLIPSFPIPGIGSGPFRIEDRMRQLGVTDVRIAVINNGKIEWSKEWSQEFGRVDERPGTLVQAASITKTVTALTILSLVQEGKLKLSTNVRDIIDPALWKMIDPTGISDEPGHEVTIEKLLSHTAGISDVEGEGEFYSIEALDREAAQVQQRIDLLTENLSSPAFQGNRPSLEAEIMIAHKKLQELQEMRKDKKAVSMPLSSDAILRGVLGRVHVQESPGGLYAYSNPGFTILQKIIETVTAESFEKVVQNRVMTTLGMTATTFSPPIESIVGGNDDEGRPLAGSWRPIPYTSAGGLWTTAEDFAKVILGIQGALVNRSHPGRKVPLIDRALAEQMVREPSSTDPTDYTLGTEVKRTKEGHLYFGHKGANIGCCNRMLGNTEGQGVVVLTNSLFGGNILSAEIIRSVAEAYAWPGRETLPSIQVELKKDEVCPVNLDTWVNGEGGVGGRYVFRKDREGKDPEVHTVEVVYERGEAIAKFDGGKPPEGETHTLMPLNHEVACYRGDAVGEYKPCRFSQEEDGTMVLVLSEGKRYIGPKKVKRSQTT